MVKQQIKSVKYKYYKVVGVDADNTQTNLCFCSSLKEAIKLQGYYEGHNFKIKKYDRITFARAF